MSIRSMLKGEKRLTPSRSGVAWSMGRGGGVVEQSSEFRFDVDLIMACPHLGDVSGIEARLLAPCFQVGITIWVPA